MTRLAGNIHWRAMPSSPVARTLAPSDANTAARNGRAEPAKVATRSASLTRQTSTVPSAPAPATSAPVAENARARTAPPDGANRPISLAVPTFHRRTVPSAPALTIVSVPGATAIARTVSVCPTSRAASRVALPSDGIQPSMT